MAKQPSKPAADVAAPARRSSTRNRTEVARTAAGSARPASVRRPSAPVQGGVGLRRATGKISQSSKVVEANSTMRARLRETQEVHRKKVWEKLDAAKQRATERTERLKAFQPDRDREVDDDFDF